MPNLTPQNQDVFYKVNIQIARATALIDELYQSEILTPQMKNKIMALSAMVQILGKVQQAAAELEAEDMEISPEKDEAIIDHYFERRLGKWLLQQAELLKGSMAAREAQFELDFFLAGDVD